MENKTCKICHKLKSLEKFNKNPLAADGYYYVCKECGILKGKLYRQSKKGLIAGIFSSQKASSRHRGHTQPTYTKKELVDWCYSQPKFHLLYDNWKRLDYQTEYTPSIDRKDDYIGYTMSNIQIVTWGDNRVKSWQDRKSGRNNKAGKVVNQYNLDMKLLNTYHSARQAERQTGIAQASIGRCCKGVSKTAGKFIWQFEEIDEDADKLETLWYETVVKNNVKEGLK